MVHMLHLVTKGALLYDNKGTARQIQNTEKHWKIMPLLYLMNICKIVKYVLFIFNLISITAQLSFKNIKKF